MPKKDNKLARLTRPAKKKNKILARDAPCDPSNDHAVSLSWLGHRPDDGGLWRDHGLAYDDTRENPYCGQSPGLWFWGRALTDAQSHDG